MERGAYQVKCEFCGVVNDLAHAAGDAPPMAVRIDVSGVPARAPGAVVRAIGWLVGLGVLMTAAFGGFTTWTVQQHVRSAVGAVTHSGDLQRETQTARVAPASLDDAGFGWKVLDVPAPPGGWARVDPVATREWALGIARLWQADAHLTRIDLSRMPAEGTIALGEPPSPGRSSDDGESVGYRFVSESRQEVWVARAAAGEREPRVKWGLMLTVAGGQVRALATGGRPGTRDEKTMGVDSLPLPKILAAAAKGHGFTPAAFYDGYMVFLPDEGWVWYLTGFGQNTSQPRVRARDGLVFPYR